MNKLFESRAQLHHGKLILARRALRKQDVLTTVEDVVSLRRALFVAVRRLKALEGRLSRWGRCLACRELNALKEAVPEGISYAKKRETKQKNTDICA